MYDISTYLAKTSEGSKTVVPDIGGLEWDHVDVGFYLGFLLVFRWLSFRSGERRIMTYPQHPAVLLVTILLAKLTKIARSSNNID